MHSTAKPVLVGAVSFLLFPSCSEPHRPQIKSVGPTVDVPNLVIAVKLSPAAKERLTSIHESIEVLAMFDGDPLPGQGTYNAPMRDVVLGSAEMPVDRNNTATFKGVRIPLRQWEKLSDKNYYVTINIYSARLAADNNLLDCNDPMSQRIETFRGKSLAVSCWLIGEPGAPTK